MNNADLGQRRAALREKLRASTEAVTDDDFDATFLPMASRRTSTVFWTPVTVARRVATLLGELRASTLLDVGSGIGKLSVITAVCAPSVSVTGVEHEPDLVVAARALSTSMGTRNVKFEHGDVTTRSWAPFDAVYVFNSFSENGLSSTDPFERGVALSTSPRFDEVMRVERRLAERAVGAILLTYHGLGGPIPSVYECIHEEAIGTDTLRAWRKSKTLGRADYWLEDGLHVRRATSEDVLRHVTPRARAR